ARRRLDAGGARARRLGLPSHHRRRAHPPRRCDVHRRAVGLFHDVAGVLMQPYWIKWDELPWERVNDQIDRKVVVRERLMMVMYRFAPHLAWPEERHAAEQGGYIIRGALELTLPDENTTVVLKSGDGYLIASMARHSWRTLEEGALFVDVFSPPRAE